ncbi:MAG: hypothetical protein AB1641_19325 [Thermodesulfobacteriota bacterium]
MTKRQMAILVVLAILSGFLGGALAGRWAPGPAQAAADKYVTANAFHLVDQQGQLRAGLLISQEGHPALVFYDAAGKIKTFLGRQDSGRSSLTFYDPNGVVRQQLEVAANGDPSLSLFDAKSELRAILGTVYFKKPGFSEMERRPEGSLILYTPAGRMSVELPAVYSK